MLPADLVAAPEGDDSLSGLQRLSLEELQRLADAQDAAAPAGETLLGSQAGRTWSAEGGPLILSAIVC